MEKSLRNEHPEPGSFRDPSGSVFYRNGNVFRQINLTCKDDYEMMMSSGLYSSLTDAGLLIRHEEVKENFFNPRRGYKVIKPEPVEFISYPYEWCFSQLKDAAITTFEIQKIAIKHGMSLKDSSAYNIQFMNGKPVFIDTLSFEKYKEGRPWVAYKQACQHFLAPLALMVNRDISFNRFLRIHVEGIPLDLASSILSFRTFFNFPLLIHIHLHSKSQKHYADKTISKNEKSLKKKSLLGLVDSLETAISGMKWHPEGTEWAEYYEDTNYSEDGIREKEKIIEGYLARIKPDNVWDFGSNDGRFSRVASEKGINTISFDNDPAAVEKNYSQAVSNNERNILPLLFDINNPSPGIGWDNRERKSLRERGPADTIFALALVHHLAISNNLPFDKIASYFADNCRNLIIEFIPKNDSKVKKLLSTREDIFPDYHRDSFESIFSRYFNILERNIITESKRSLYLMEKK